VAPTACWLQGTRGPISHPATDDASFGLAISCELDKEGFRVAVGYSKSEAQASAGAESIVQGEKGGARLPG